MKGENVKLAFVWTIDGGNLSWLQFEIWLLTISSTIYGSGLILSKFILVVEMDVYKIAYKRLADCNDSKICSHAQASPQKRRFPHRSQRALESSSRSYTWRPMIRAVQVALLDRQRARERGIYPFQAFCSAMMIRRPIFRC